MDSEIKKAGDDTSELKDSFLTYARRWKTFLLFILLALLLAFAYLRYATEEYVAQAKIQILNEKNSGPNQFFQEIDLISPSNNEVQDEIEIINSQSNFEEVVRELGLNVKILAVGRIKDTEIYSTPPIKLNFIGHDTLLNRETYSFYLTVTSDNTFNFSEEDDSPAEIMAFGKPIQMPLGNTVITPNIENIVKFKNKKLKVVISPISMVAQNYRSKIQISSPEDFSNIVNISINDPIKEKGVDLINTLIQIYNRNAIEDKKAIADRTSNFIDERIADISSNLSNVDQSAEELKTSKGLTDIASEANINLNVGAANRQELANYRTQMQIAASMQEILSQQGNNEVLPANIGLNDPSIANTTQLYNQLVAERNRLLKSSTERSPTIQNLDQQLNSLRQSLESSLNGMVNNLSMQVSTLSNQQAIINSKIYSAPGNERELRDITRRQQTTEQLYLYLLQKREEAQIAVASQAPKSKIIDHAHLPSELPASPQKKRVYLSALILGLLVPFGIIYVRDLLDNKVKNKQSLESLTSDIPVLGELPKLDKSHNKIVIKDDRSILAEALRIIRTNLDFILRSQPKRDSKNNLVFVTSGVPGEGKTFLSTNLSMILASTNKKVLLVGADIRNPKLYQFFTGKNVDNLKKVNTNKDSGLTEFLTKRELSLPDIVNPMLVHHNLIDVVYSGRIPPNPAELLMGDRMGQFLEEVSRIYDYVIVDTAPLLVVTDTLLISDYANHVIYVTRAGVTEQQAVKYPIQLLKEGKLKSLSFVVNDVKSHNLGYGGKYGYGYSKPLKKWWKL